VFKYLRSLASLGIRLTAKTIMILSVSLTAILWVSWAAKSKPTVHFLVERVHLEYLDDINLVFVECCRAGK